MVKVGIIGCGKIAQVRHLPEYAQNSDVKIHGVYDINEQRAQETAEAYDCRYYHSYQELLADSEVDAVSVCAANAMHCEITVAALYAGKHVLCEKPMAVTLSECRQMADTAKETGKYLMIGHNQRLTKAHVAAKTLIAHGELGRILTFRTSFGHSGPESWAIDKNNIWFFDKTLASFGAMADLGIHKTDLIQYLTGQKIIEVSAFLGVLDKKDSQDNPISVDDNALCLYKLEGGGMGTMTASWTYYGAEDNATIIYGTKGIMHIYDNPQYSIMIERLDGSRIKYELESIQTNEHQTKSGIIDEWITSIVNQTPPEISGQGVLSAMEAVFAAMESAKTGKTIHIK